VLFENLGFLLKSFFLQVAVAKHLGLQVLRLADSIILPINTTHYAYELETYLERQVARADIGKGTDKFSGSRTLRSPLQMTIKSISLR
jgi:N-acetylated-alpha-linked acidic dipeptidase